MTKNNLMLVRKFGSGTNLVRCANENKTCEEQIDIGIFWEENQSAIHISS